MREGRGGGGKIVGRRRSVVFVEVYRLWLRLLLRRCPLFVSEVLCEDIRFAMQGLRRVFFGEAKLFRGKTLFDARDVIVEELASFVCCCFRHSLFGVQGFVFSCGLL